MVATRKRVDVVLDAETLNPALANEPTTLYFEIFLQQKYQRLLRDPEGTVTVVDQHPTAQDSMHRFQTPSYALTLPPPFFTVDLTGKISRLGLHHSVSSYVVSSIARFTRARRLTSNGGLRFNYLVKAAVTVVDEEVIDEEEFLMTLMSLSQVDEPRGVSRSTLEKLNKEGFYMEESSGCAGETCTVCLDEFSSEVELTRLPCTHIFHQPCIFQWLENRNSCPLCRCEIS